MSKKPLYWIPTVLLCAMMLLSAGMYFINYEEISQLVPKLGFPSYIIYPLAMAKILGVVAILSNKSKLLSEWAYAGFFFDFVLAASAHLNVGDGEAGGAFLAIVLVLVSRYFWYLREG